jgi:hypothetical protein
MHYRYSPEVKEVMNNGPGIFPRDRGENNNIFPDKIGKG